MEQSIYQQRGEQQMPRTDATKQIGQRIKLLRNRKSISQDGLADMLGLRQPSLSQIESGRVMLRVDYLRMICQQLQVTYDWLLDGTGFPDRSPLEVAQQGIASPWTAVPIRRTLVTVAYGPNRLPQEDCLLLPLAPERPLTAFEVPDNSFAPSLYVGDLALGWLSEIPEAIAQCRLMGMVTADSQVPQIVESVVQEAWSGEFIYRKEPNGRVHSVPGGKVVELWELHTRMGPLKYPPEP